MMVDSFQFPKDVPNYYTRLSLRKYSRPRPGSSVTSSLMTSIRLPLPQSMADSYAMDINDTKLDILGNDFGDALSAGKTRAKKFYDDLMNSGNALGAIKEMALQAAALTPGVSDSGLGKAAQLETGLIRNPHLTTLFEGVRIKSYTFTWKMAPRSQDEANELERMINYIKAYMHPQIVGGGFALEYPYLANVDFVAGDNQSLPKVDSSFITRLDINNSASGTPAFYKDGKSVSVEMTLGFQEINIKTRDDFINKFASVT